jgi:hypothetical protein
VKKVTKEFYCQFLICAQTNFTATEFATHTEDTTHDAITRFLSKTKLTPKALWEYAAPFVTLKGGVLILDDTVLDHPYGKKIGLSRWQYSGTHHEVVFGIGVETLLWSSSTELHEHIPTDFRIYHPTDDGNTKNEHARDMLKTAKRRGIEPSLVVMDSFYASVDNLHLVNDWGWTFVAGVKSNRIVFFLKEGKATKYHVNTIAIPPEGIVVRLKDYGKVRLFKFIAPDSKLCYVITNNLSSSYDDVREAYAIRWRVEEYHRGLKQTTGIEQCQARTKRSQRTHIFCSLLSFLALEKKRLEEGITWYESKRRIISDALFLYLKQPMIPLPAKR